MSRGHAAQARASGQNPGAGVPGSALGKRGRDPQMAAIFAQRKRRMLRMLRYGASPAGAQVARTPRRAGRTLLSLPEDVLVRRSLKSIRCRRV